MISLAASGNVLAIGGTIDSASIGASWIFTRNSTTGNWTQAGSKLVGTGTEGATSQQGRVVISADGTTLASGGFSDNTNIGAVWMFVIGADGNWSQQGSKLVPAIYTGTPRFGFSVALSADGNTLAMSGYSESSSAGGVWIWKRANSVWSIQTPAKLLGTGSAGTTQQQGTGISLSADGNTLAASGPNDNTLQGAVWIWTQSGGTWTQRGSKLVPSDATTTGTVSFGISVALSANGGTLVAAGYYNMGGIGAVWVFE